MLIDAANATAAFRDIKPENILLYPIPFRPAKVTTTADGNGKKNVDEGQFLVGLGSGGIGRIKITDFGLSRSLWDGHTTRTGGTRGYAAPEIAKGKLSSRSVDVWALGCVLYILLCGFPPFSGTDTQNVEDVVAHGQYAFLSPWWDDISDPARDLVSHLLKVEPVQRYTMAEFFGHPWICKRENHIDS